MDGTTMAEEQLKTVSSDGASTTKAKAGVQSSVVCGVGFGVKGPGYTTRLLGGW